MACPACGYDNPDRAKFCLECGNSMSSAAFVAAAEERKVVTVLFCDLVGFTAASDAADPEEVRARIRPYHQLLKTAIEGYGGTVEKFIGDAVMAVFGAPTAHEDDAERAIRAGLRILEAIAELDEADPTLALQVRIGINTGEAVVTLGAKAAEGEGIVTGDVVNTASRLQGVAPVGGIAVGEQTYLATINVFTYEALEPVELKGKSSPVSIWRPSAARSRFGVDVTRAHTTPFVGRDADLALLKATFEKSLRESSVQLVTIVGEPGAGKSRIVAELQRFVDDRPELITWRQGRCLPYGDGITFWALGEIVKAQAGIFETDEQEVAADKLDAMIPPEHSDREWLRLRLAPLVGLASDPGTAREELFTAWRRFLESVAEHRPAVLIFEDLHWADEPMLAFLEHLAEWSEGVPMLLVGTARPELYERHPNWASRIRAAATVNLSPLSEEETSRLIAGMLDQALLPGEIHGLIIERAGGNPLYAEEFVRMLRDRELLVPKGRSLELAEEIEVPMPESVQSLIAARLDTLSPDRKHLLQDASVVGKVFWSGVLEQMSGTDRHEIDVALHELSRKELVRTERRSSMEGEIEYAFWHALVRDVCYAQIPKTQRGDKHVAVADWLEERAGDRVDDLAEILAHHYLDALASPGNTAVGGDRESTRQKALRFLLVAGEQAAEVDVARAEAHLRSALAISDASDDLRPRIMEWLARVLDLGGRLAEARELYRQSVAAYREHGRNADAALALARSCASAMAEGHTSEADAALDLALDLLGDGPDDLTSAEVWRMKAGLLMVTGRHHDAIGWADRAIELVGSIEGQEARRTRARALDFRGTARIGRGDPAGLQDSREALSMLVAEGLGASTANAYNNLSLAVWLVEGPEASQGLVEDGIRFAESRGLSAQARFLRNGSLTNLYELGRWNEALELAELIRTQAESEGARMEQAMADVDIVRIHQLRGVRSDTDHLIAGMLNTVREFGDQAIRNFVLSIGAAHHHLHGRKDAGIGLLEELVESRREVDVIDASDETTDAVRVALAIGSIELAEEIVARVSTTLPRARFMQEASWAAIVEAKGDAEAALPLYEGALAGWVEHGNMVEEAFAQLGLGRCSLAIGRPAEAHENLSRAQQIFALLGARPLLGETDTLLGRASAIGS